MSLEDSNLVAREQATLLRRPGRDLSPARLARGDGVGCE